MPKFKIENDTYDWDSDTITGAEVRALGPGIPDTMDLFVKLPGQPGRLIENSEPVSLENPGIEKFYSQNATSTPGQ